MKIKINWKELGKQLWDAVKPVLLGAIGGGLVAVTGSGCSALTPSAKTQTMSLYAIGIPGIAVVTHSTQDADNKGDDENRPTQANPVSPAGTGVVPCGGVRPSLYGGLTSPVRGFGFPCTDERLSLRRCGGKWLVVSG